ncbi:MAG: LytTR family transcriptional regulator [Lachnospiraceae bacterium]|nr:LytTR family transcriptional regulator [Lachnospiraceae bacterium]
MKIRISVSEEKYVSVEKYLNEHGIEISDDAEYILTESSGHPAFIQAKDDKKDRVRISAEDVVFIEAFGKDIEIHTESDIYHSQDRMYELESLLDPKEFIRVSKSVIISRKHVKKIRPSLSMKYILTMTDGTLIDVTRSYYSDFRRFFGI